MYKYALAPKRNGKIIYRINICLWLTSSSDTSGNLFFKTPQLSLCFHLDIMCDTVSAIVDTQWLSSSIQAFPFAWGHAFLGSQSFYALLYLVLVLHVCNQFGNSLNSLLANLSTILSLGVPTLDGQGPATNVFVKLNPGYYRTYLL
jgi:hypothetical protein